VVLHRARIDGNGAENNVSYPSTGAVISTGALTLLDSVIEENQARGTETVQVQQLGGRLELVGSTLRETGTRPVKLVRREPAFSTASMPLAQLPSVGTGLLLTSSRLESAGSEPLLDLVLAGGEPSHSNTFMGTGPRWIDNRTPLSSGDLELGANFWGPALTATLAATPVGGNVPAFWDYFDDFERSRVVYDGWASGAFPRAHVDAPSFGRKVRQGATVSLQGHAEDPEDGALASSALRWSSDRDGAVGAGVTVQTSALSLGRHRITLTARDSAGQEAQTWIELDVVP
jgi:hypothetical protein